jgi:mercuric ion transport protein
MEQVMDGKKCFRTGLWGSIIAAICCFTPLLVVGIGLIGLAALTPYLDYLLFPALAFFLVLAFYGWRKMESRSESNSY